MRNTGRARCATDSIIAASGSVMHRFSGTTRNANSSVTFSAMWNCRTFSVASEAKSNIAR